MDHATLYCNPIPLPEYPMGMLHADKQGWGWTRDDRPAFREAADPSVLFWEGAWYLFVSGGAVYVSRNFVDWEHHPIPQARIGYAPTIVAWAGSFWLTASNTPLYRAPHPLGPYEDVGFMEEPNGERLHKWSDPMLFADEDGRLYAYWGITDTDPGIMGGELDPQRPQRLLHEKRVLFSFDRLHKWEWMGDHHENGAKSFLEGAWMVKLGGTYFLTYTAPGTEWKTYGLGCYQSQHPLGPFRYQTNNPILQQRHGLVHGTGHGCLVEGPGKTLWAFYTCLVRNDHAFERRIGMDAAGVDENGELFVAPATDVPQFAPGIQPNPELGNAAGFVPVSSNKWATASSSLEGRTPDYAIDDSQRTWWQPRGDDPAPWLEIDLRGSFSVSALRLLWRDGEFIEDREPTLGRFRRRVLCHAGGDWFPLPGNPPEAALDLIEFAACPKTRMDRIRIEILGSPSDERWPALLEVTAFGQWP
jgi:hypothetical protein